MITGDMERFLELADKARSWIAHEFGLQPADAADIVQEVLIRLYRRPPVDVRHHKAYLYKACARRAWKFRQRQSRLWRLVPLEAAEQCAAEEVRSGPFDNDHPRLSRLSRRQRQVACLMAQGYSQVDAASELRLHPVTVRGRVFQMRQLFQQETERERAA